MKKYLFSLLTLLVSATMCISLVSCGDDDNGGGSQTDIVGSYTISGILEDANGTERSYSGTMDITSSAFSMNITFDDDNSTMSYSSPYTLNGSSFKFYINDAAHVYSVIPSSDGTKLNITYVSGNGLKMKTITATRNSRSGSSLSVTKENLVGKWTLSTIEFKHKTGYEASTNASESDAGEMTITLNEDGSGVWYGSDSGGWDEANFKWSINGNKVIMHYGDSFAFTRTLFEVVYLQSEILKTPMDVTTTSTLDYSEFEYVYLVFKRVK